VLDTGVDVGHPDLDANIVDGASFVAGSPWNSDPNGHGTAMAGIVAAETGNGIGVAGVGYAGVSVMPVTVLGPNGLGRDSDIIEGLVWAADHHADVALMAFSASGFSSALQAAIDYAWSKGVVVVAATGNDGSSAPPSRRAIAA
jgi:subtilisin family serine protease